MATLPKFIPLDPEQFKRVLRLPRPLREKLVARFKEKHHQYAQEVLQLAFEKSLVTPQEYEEKFKGRFYGDFGTDSFIDYLGAVMDGQGQRFLTDNERLLRRREEFQQRFGLKIISMKEMEKIIEEENRIKEKQHRE